MIVTKKRSLIKAIIWRVIGSIDTFILSLIIINFSSQNYTYDLAFYIATLELLTKTIFYYLHERLWNQLNIGRVKKKVNRTRSLVKAFTWRIAASLDTFLISYLITGRFDWATSIASFEIITKAILYYLHERGWNKIDWGRIY
tara:strand:+ start:1223 stop:1651 length:429 start_codon:yes stop_codon:yes gene_type:complete